MEEKIAGGKFREIPCALDIYFAGGKFRAKSKFANIAKISSTRKIRVIQYMDGMSHICVNLMLNEVLQRVTTYPGNIEHVYIKM